MTGYFRFWPTTLFNKARRLEILSLKVLLYVDLDVSQAQLKLRHLDLAS